MTRTDAPAGDLWIRLVRSTGLKMFVILTLALLPLGIIALFASLQSIHTADVERDGLLRLTAVQSARKLSSEFAADRAALRIVVAAFANGSADPNQCWRTTAFLGSRAEGLSDFAIHARDGRLLCGHALPSSDAVPTSTRFSGPEAQLLPQAKLLALRVVSPDRSVVAIRYYGRGHMDDIADPATALQNRRLTLVQGDQRLAISKAALAGPGRLREVEAPVGLGGITLVMAVREPPTTIFRSLSLFLPLLMWFAAAAVGWYVVNRLLIRPLVDLRRAVADYQPGQVLRPLARMRTPAAEIAALGNIFREISEDVASHEAEMAESLDQQKRLTREVHHRVKNNLQIIASLINLHARAATEPEAIDAYASIQRRVDALSVVHRNHFADSEQHRGVNIRSLISELAASLRGTAPAQARHFAIQIDCVELQISQDVAVPVAFLLTELFELAMLADPAAGMRISVRAGEDGTRAALTVQSPALRADLISPHLHDRFDRVLLGLSRQLRAPLDRDEDAGGFAIAIPVIAQPTDQAR